MNERHRVIERAADSYRALADLAETVEDEWQYVTDLTDAYTPAILSLAESESGRPWTAGQTAAVDLAIAEIALITDPHKAIDWLSTFPHVVALAVGSEMDEPAGSGGAGFDLDTDAANDDSPFRVLREPRR